MHHRILRAAVALALVTGTGLAAAQSRPDGVSVAEIVVARGIEDHEPVEAGTSFSRSGGPLVCFVRAENRTGAEAAVFVSWESAATPVGSAHGGTRLTIPASRRYRTYARTAVARPAGDYRCVVRDESGDVLGSAPFTLTD